MYTRMVKKQNNKILIVDKDSEFNYNAKDKIIAEMIATMKKDYSEFQRAYDETPDTSIGAKARLKASLDEKKEDIKEAEKIATSFKNDEAEDIENATRIIKYECENLRDKIKEAEEEINRLKNRLTSKKSGLIDIASKNKDKDVLKELAQIVIDIKHRRQFPEAPIDIINRLEEYLGLDLIKDIDIELINNTSKIIPRDYDQYIKEDYQLIDSLDETPIDEISAPPKRGIKVIDEAQITIPSNILDDVDNEDSEISQPDEQLTSNIEENTSNESNLNEESVLEPEKIEEEQIPVENPLPTEIANNEELPSEEEKEEEVTQESNKEENNEPQDNNPLSIDTIFNPEKKYEELQNNNKQVTTEDLTHELDQYINSLDNNQN